MKKLSLYIMLPLLPCALFSNLGNAQGPYESLLNPKFSEIPVTMTKTQWEKKKQQDIKKARLEALKKYRPKKDALLESLYVKMGTNRSLIIDIIFKAAERRNLKELQRLESFALNQVGNTTDARYKELEKKYADGSINQETLTQEKLELEKIHQVLVTDIKHIASKAFDLYNDPEITIE